MSTKESHKKYAKLWTVVYAFDLFGALFSLLFQNIYGIVFFMALALISFTGILYELRKSGD